MYRKEDGGADTAVWLAGDKDATGSDLVAHQTVLALRAVGLLDDITMTQEGIVVYPAGLDAEG